MRKLFGHIFLVLCVAVTIATCVHAQSDSLTLSFHSRGTLTWTLSCTRGPRSADFDIAGNVLQRARLSKGAIDLSIDSTTGRPLRLRVHVLSDAIQTDRWISDEQWAESTGSFDSLPFQDLGNGVYQLAEGTYSGTQITDEACIHRELYQETVREAHDTTTCSLTLSLRVSPVGAASVALSDNSPSSPLRIVGTSNRITLLCEPIDQPAILHIVDLLGIERIGMPLETGVNRVPIPIHSLHAGIYFAQLGRETAKFAVSP